MWPSFVLVSFKIFLRFIYVKVHTSTSFILMSKKSFRWLGRAHLCVRVLPTEYRSSSGLCCVQCSVNIQITDLLCHLLPVLPSTYITWQ